VVMQLRPGGVPNWRRLCTGLPPTCVNNHAD
jgi:hypothetical protein